MTYKPHLGLLIPVALLAGRQWRAIAGAITSAGALLLASVLLFGPDIWRDYPQHRQRAARRRSWKTER